MVYYSSHDFRYRPDMNYMEWERLAKHQGEGYSPDMANTLRILRQQIKICKEDNEDLI